MVPLLLSGSSINNEELQKTLYINTVTEVSITSILVIVFMLSLKQFQTGCITQETTFAITWVLLKEILDNILISVEEECVLS